MQQAIIFVLATILLAVITNFIIYALGWNKDRNAANNQPTNPLLPPGWGIGIIWTFIFGVLGFAMHLSLESNDKLSMVLIAALIASCLAYPFYTSGLDANKAARVGNISTLIGAFLVTVTIAIRSPSVLPYMAPVLIWSSYVNVTEAIHE